MPNEWPTVRLEEVCVRVTDGTHQSPRFETTGIPFLVISNVVSGDIDWAGVSKWVDEETYESNTSRCRPERGDVLYTAVGSFGVAVPVETDKRFMFQRHIAHIKPDLSRVHTRFLAHILNSPMIRAVAERVAKGVAQRTVTLGDLKDFRIPLPPLPEQRRVADILDRADAIRRKRKEAMALTEELLRSAFLEMFGDPVTNPKGWDVKELGEVCDVGGGLQVTHARETNPVVLPYLRVANVFRDRLELTEIKEIRVSEAEAERAALRVGDVLVVEGHGNPDELGRAAVWGGEILKCTHQNHLIRVRPQPGVLESIFLSAYLNSAAGRAQMLRMGKTTSGLNTISTNNVRAVSMLLPPFHVQRSFGRLVDRKKRVLGRMVSSAMATEELFGSLVRRAFRGELTGTNGASKPQVRRFDAGCQ